jgi:hypothetical protein
VDFELTGERPIMAPDVALPGWEGLDRYARWDWWQELWCQAVVLSRRYRLALRSGWWEDELQVEILAALAAWVGMFDSGAWTDPPSKLQLIFELDRVRALLRGGESVFHPERDQEPFEQHLRKLGCETDDET